MADTEVFEAVVRDDDEAIKQHHRNATNLNIETYSFSLTKHDRKDLKQSNRFNTIGNSNEGEVVQELKIA